ncbi:hypothetical protein ACQ4PT_055337 [Festuca glaucescens]
MVGLLELNGVVPPRSTQTYCLLMEKKPPSNMNEFAVILECCIEHKGIADVNDQFLPEVLELTQGNNVPSCIVYILNSTDLTIHWVQERVTSVETFTPTDHIRCAKFIARKHWFLAGDSHGFIHVYACETNHEVKKLKAHDGVVISLAVHPTDPLLLSSSTDRHIKLWNWEANWKCIRKLKAHSGNVEKVVFDPRDSQFFASVGIDNTIKIWRTSSPLPVSILNCRESQLTVDYFHPGGDRQYIVTGSVSGKVRIWDVKTNTCIRQINGLQVYPGRCVGVLDCFPDCPLLVTTLEGNITSVYNFDTDR